MANHLFLLNLRKNPKTNESDTVTSVDQTEIERIICKAYDERLGDDGVQSLLLQKDNHVSYLQNRLVNLPSSFECLDASQSWLAYWITHGLSLLRGQIKDEHRKSLIKLIKSCQAVVKSELIFLLTKRTHLSAQASDELVNQSKNISPDSKIDKEMALGSYQPSNGGFSGGPYQFAHLATTYGAVNCLCLLNDEEAYDTIDRENLYKCLMNLKSPQGAFLMQKGGEVDVRGSYCAVSVAKLVNLETDELFKGTAEWIASCQTYEGGFGGSPGLEAHGGYTFCAFSALVLLGKTHLINIRKLLHWAAMRQMSLEGGFQGRTNKLVDSCYSFWVGGLFPLIQANLLENRDSALSCDSQWMFHTGALKEYLLVCCQKLPNGGMLDKPGKHPDPYHTCYALSGLSLAQHFVLNFSQSPIITDDNPDNLLEPTDPRYNILSSYVQQTLTYFYNKGKIPAIKGSS